MTDDGGWTRGGDAGKEEGRRETLGGGALAVQATLGKTPSTKNSRKIVKGVRVGLIRRSSSSAAIPGTDATRTRSRGSWTSSSRGRVQDGRRLMRGC